ncbi:MAG TPA: hypothetical protein VFT00_09125 [Nocardioides sp.]|nr:hypothetical protein [Nocardioides sp.]
MSLTSLSALHTHAQEATSGGINHWLVGGITLGILLAMIAALLMFGAGREHS